MTRARSISWAVVGCLASWAAPGCVDTTPRAPPVAANADPRSGITLPREWPPRDGTNVAGYEDPDKEIAFPVLGPGGLLFCVLFDEEDSTQDEIVALDAQTLQPRHRFGLSLLFLACGMAVARSSSSATAAMTGCRSSHSRASTAARSRASGSGPWRCAS